MTSLRTFQRPNVWGSLIRIALVVGWFFSGEGLAPMLCAAISALDSQHEIHMSVSGDGEVRLILTHDEETGHHPAEEIGVEHQLPALMLLMFATSAGTEAHDHHISFNELEESRRRREVRSPSVPAATCVALAPTAPTKPFFPAPASTRDRRDNSRLAALRVSAVHAVMQC